MLILKFAKKQKKKTNRDDQSRHHTSRHSLKDTMQNSKHTLQRNMCTSNLQKLKPTNRTNVATYICLTLFGQDHSPHREGISTSHTSCNLMCENKAPNEHIISSVKLIVQAQSSQCEPSAAETGVQDRLYYPCLGCASHCALEVGALSSLLVDTMMTLSAPQTSTVERPVFLLP